VFILELREVKACSVLHEGRQETGIRAYGKVFRKAKLYPLPQLKQALIACRSTLDQNMLCVLLKQEDGYTLCLQASERVGDVRTSQ
jgi:hypothetical protein